MELIDKTQPEPTKISRRDFIKLSMLGLLAGCRLPSLKVKNTPIPTDKSVSQAINLPGFYTGGSKPMKITDIKLYPISLSDRNMFIVKVETDQGIIGWGEGGLSTRELAEAGAVRHYREFLIGRDPLRRGALWQEMYRSQYFEGGRVLTAAISAIDIALHDICGKVLGIPVYKLLGGNQRDVVPCFGTIWGSSASELIDKANTYLHNKWPAIRIEAYEEGGNVYDPRKSIAVTADWMVKMRETLGLEPVLGVEYHHRLSVAEAASFCQRIPSGTLDFLEEPIRDETPEAYEELRKMVDVPFAIGEEFSSKWIFAPYIERGITNFARIDICNVGGFTEAMKVAGLAELHYIDLMPHNPLGPICTAATIQLGAAVPNFAWMEVWASPTGELNFDPDLFPLGPKLDGANFIVPETPGLGIEVNETLLIKKAEGFTFREMPHFRRPDGSHTNW